MNETSIITKIRNLFQKPIVRDICIVVFIGVFLYSFCRTAEYVYTNWFGRTNHNRAMTQWNRVKNQTSQALSLIDASNLKLTEAQSLTMRQSDELNKLKSINEKQANELMKAKQDSMKQNDYLNQTNKYLEIANKEIQQSKRTEARLHRQRDIWAVVAGAATLGAIVAAAK